MNNNDNIHGSVSVTYISAHQSLIHLFSLKALTSSLPPSPTAPISSSKMDLYKYMIDLHVNDLFDLHEPTHWPCCLWKALGT